MRRSFKAAFEKDDEELLAQATFLAKETTVAEPPFQIMADVAIAAASQAYDLRNSLTRLGDKATPSATRIQAIHRGRSVRRKKIAAAMHGRFGW